jgi:predicted Mrr-cat superfamily restriction endonuclease
MALWLVRAGKHGERESEALDMGIAAVGWNKIGTHTADYGLLVSWGGFTAAVCREAEAHHFRVCLWDQSDLLDAHLQ